MSVIGDIMKKYSMICSYCARERSLPWIGHLYHGQCDYCDRRWVDIVEIEQEAPAKKAERGGAHVQERLRENITPNDTPSLS
jgi:hypothetical protein